MQRGLVPKDGYSWERFLGLDTLDAKAELAVQTKGRFMKIVVSFCVPEIMVISLSSALRNLNAQ